MARKRHGKASCMRIDSLSPLQSNRVIADVLMFFVFLRSKSGDMSAARVGAFAQRVAHTIVEREVAVAHEATDFQNMKVVVLPRLYTPVNFSFPF